MLKLREYQQEAHDLTIQHCKTSSEPVYHDHSVGAGKSLSIAYFTKHVIDKGGSVLNLSRQGEIAEQNYVEYWAIKGKGSMFSASIGTKSTFYPAIFGTEGTVCRSLRTDFIDRKFNVITIDECHELRWQDFIECQTDMNNGFDIYENKDKEGKTKYSQYAVILCHFYRLNPKLRVIGYSGSPFRGSESITGQFWKKKLTDVSTMHLVGLGYLVPPAFGFGDTDHLYDLKEFSPSKNGNSGDFSSKDLQAMQRKIVKDKTKTELIIEEVIERTKDRLGVLITCAGKAHCKQVAELLPVGTWGIVTDDTSTKERRRILNDAKSGKIKYTLQVNCLGQGVNCTYWDTCVILRKIGSLRYLIQLIGRVLRLLKPEQFEQGLTKSEGLVLDFTDTLDEMGNIYENPIIEQASAQKAFISNETQQCPDCEQHNSMYAVRCIGESTDEEDGRCGYFFKYNMCFRCETKNSPSASNCRKCKAIMIDPAQKLKGKAYSDDDYKKVLSMEWENGKAKGLWVKYYLDSIFTKNGIESQEVAKEYYDPFSKEHHHKVRWNNFLNAHINGQSWRYQVKQKRSVNEILHSKAMFDVPTHITHRVNEKFISIIARRKFLSGREAK